MVCARNRFAISKSFRQLGFWALLVAWGISQARGEQSADKDSASPAVVDKSAAAAPASEVPAANAPADASPDGEQEPPVAGDKQLTFTFRYQPWQEVLDWFAEQAGLSLVMEAPPSGTFNYSDSRSYSVPQALDVINGVLLTKGHSLVRSGHMLVLVNLEDGIPPNLVPDVPLGELDQRGEYELIRVLFPVWSISPDQAAEEVQPLLGPQGKVVTLPQARQIQVTETAGRLRTIRSVVDAVEQPKAGTAGLREFPLKYLSFDAAMPTIRNMLGIPAEAFSTPDGAVQVTKSATGGKLLFRGTAQNAARLAEILRLIDVPEAAPGIDGAPQLEVYPVTTADPAAVLKVLEAIFRDEPNVRLATDAETGYVTAFATPPQQATIRATIDQMQKDNRQVDVISLSNLDPQVAVLAISNLFGGGGKEPDPKAPKVDADLATRSLMVRGTPSQLEQIRDLLRKLGETEQDGGSATSKQHVRLLPLTGAAARSAVAQIEQIWPSVRPNRIRVVTPTAAIPTYRPNEAEDEESKDRVSRPVDQSGHATPEELQELWQLLRGNGSPESSPKTTPSPDQGTSSREEGPVRPGVFRLIAGQATQETGTQSVPQRKPTSPADQQRARSALASRGAPILVAPGPGGVLIASDDLEALDQLEDLLTIVAGRSASTGREYAVFYLKYAKAANVAEVLAAIFGGSTGGQDKGIIGDMASNALGDVGGGLMSDLLLGGSGGSSFSSASVDIIPDARLNALIVHAKPSDLDTIEMLYRILDQRTGPDDVQADAEPRAIQLFHRTATDVASIVQQVYQDRMSGPAGVMSPAEMMKMIRGGNNAEQQVPKMSIAVDSDNNILIVRAADPLFEEVKRFVNEIDQAGSESPETTRVVSLRHTNSDAVQRALNSILGNSVQTSTTPAATGDSQRRDRDDDDSPEERARQAMRRNWEMMQEMRRMQERMGGDRGDNRSGFDRSRFFGRGVPDGSRGGGDDGDRGGDRGRGRD
jgi:type II secretory pathway component GspD/PulD (secretin)